MSTSNERQEMKQRMIIAIAILTTPLLFSKLIDVHVPTKEDIYFHEMQERNRQTQEAFDTIHDDKSTEEEKQKAYNTLLDNGAMA